MNNKYIIWGCTFVVSLIIGYTGAKGAKILFPESTEPISDTKTIGGLALPDPENPIKLDSISKEVDIIDTNDDLTTKNTLPSTPVEDDNFVSPTQARPTIEQPEQIERMTSEEFERLLLDFNDSSLLGKHAKIKKPLTIKIVGMDPEESMIPQDVLGVRTKIENETWKTAKVKDVIYDTIGRIVSVTILAVYE